MNKIQNDADLIKRLGGPSKVAEILAIDKRGGAQRVQNWMVRGIPSQIKVNYPHIFMPELATSPANKAQPALETVVTSNDVAHCQDHAAACVVGVAVCQASGQGVHDAAR